VKKVKFKTKTIKDGDRIPRTEYRHQYAIDCIQQQINNVNLELAQKHKAIKIIMSDQALDQTPIRFMGIRIRLMQIEVKRLERSKALLVRNNHPVKIDAHTLARKDGKIK
jgi:hypothetical protein